MAECAYARCLQERRLIKRELMKWSKDMLHIVGLERVAEELMGRRKWKHYQDSLTRTHLSTDQLTATIDQLNIETQRTPSESDFKYNCSIKTEQQQLEEGSEANKEQKQQTYEENHRQKEAKEEAEVNQDQTQENKVETTIKSLTIKGEDEKEGNNNSTTSHKYIYNKNNNNNNTSVKLENNNSITNENLKASSTPAVSPVTENCDKKITNLRLHRSSTTPDKEEDYTSAITPPPPEPIDWKPNEKCYFCVDGKLLTVNSKGDLVAESGPALSEADHGQRQLIDSDSDSNDSCIGANNSTSANSLSLQSVTGGTAGNQRVNVNKILASRLRDLPANMTSMNPMAAQFAAIQSISGQLYPNLHWLQQLQQQQQQNNSATPTTSDTSAAAVSPAPKDSPSPSDATGEQPLDLSSKPSPNSSISGDLKSLSVRSKTSRSTPVLPAVGRRTYTDDDLNSALQDIISGKLGTRKASVCYNIPRSTLRNKVYKLTTDAKRANATAPAELLQLQQALELEKDLSGDEGEGESNASTPQPAEAYDDLATATLRKLCENNTRSEDVGAGEHNATASPKIAASSLVSALSEQLKRKSSTPSSGGGAQPPQPTPSPQPQIPPILIDPNVFLQTLLLSTGALQNPAALQPKLDETVTLRDLFGAILLNSGINLKDILASANAANSASNAGDTLNNGSGKSNSLSDQRLLLQQLHHQQQQQQHPISGHHQQSPPSTSAHYSRRLPKSDTPETTSSLDLNEISDDPSVILKIPSYKPVAGSSTSAAAAHLGHGTTSSAGAISPSMHCGNNSNSNRNGDSPHSQHSAQSPRIATSMLAAAVAAASGNKNSAAVHHQNNSISVISPPLGMGTDSQSPPSLSLREVFANSIQRTMNEQANKDVHASMLGLGVDSERNSSDYKKPSISVVKNIGGTDTSRFGEAPNLLTGVGGVHNSHHLHHHPHLQHPGHHHHHSSHHLSRQEAAALAAGKGTRPKRGKYRNYDRDSLVEAVKAVQRGEMSVHRAGSYYGVPHSTLEYKVKERHLMRPRKREPKPQPPDGSGTSTSASKTNSNIPGLDRTAANNLDKLSKANPSAGASKISGALKNNANPAAFPSNSPNGMKLSMFDQSVTAAQLQYAPHLFWQHSAFGPLQMDFNRAAVAQQSSAGGVNASANAASASAASSALPYVSAEILKSHMQRYQEKSMRSTPGASGSSIKSGRPSPIASPMSGQNHHALSYKSPHDLAAENGGGFLEGIIRQRLDRKSNDAAPPPVSDALLGQLLTKKTPLPFTNNRGSTDYITTPGNSAATSSGVSQLKRTGSPLPAYGSLDIKRERGSPMHSDMDGDGDGDASVSEADEHSEHNNNNNNKTLMNSDKLERRGGGERHALERSRMTSRDSDTDGGGSSNGGSLKSGGISLTNEQLSSQYYNNNSNDINGGGGSGGPLTLKAELSGATTSILQEKLGQIKSEQESEENL